MKTKPVLITIAIVAVLACGFLFARMKVLAKPEKKEIMAFLHDFDRKLEAGNVKAAVAYFEDGTNKPNITALVNLLCNKTGPNGKSKPKFKVILNVDDAEIAFANPEMPTALVSVKFERDSVESVHSTIIFTIRKADQNEFKIAGADTHLFAADYTAYQNKVIVATVPEKDSYSPITLEAFKTAEKLKSRYDSVLWFQHIDKKTWFYVINGKLPEHFDYPRPGLKEAIEYKMALLNPELKEIIPAGYDLIHNIGGTINGLIEVEKGDKKGFYDITGKLVVPVSYDQILPLTDDENLALLRNGNDYTYLKKDSTISETLIDFQVADILPKVKYYGDSYELSEKSSKTIMEFNSRLEFNSLVVSPSYLVEWELLSRFARFQDPLRKITQEDDGQDGSRSIAFYFKGIGNNEQDSWFQSAFYSVVNDYLGGRGGLYESKKLLIVDKKQNRILGLDATYENAYEGYEPTSSCHENYLRAINDSLFEYKSTEAIEQDLLDSTRFIHEGPYYHYIQVNRGKLVALKTDRVFPTQFVKLDESYLQGCYVLSHVYSKETRPKDKILDHATDEILQVMKNEIYASYQYKFKNPAWAKVFAYKFERGDDKPKNDNVDDSLTVIDRYNINWIDSKLKAKKATLASR